MIKVFRPFRQLRVMICSILACTPSLLWATFLLYLIVSVTAIYFLEIALFHLQIRNSKKDLPEDFSRAEFRRIQDGLKQNWGGLYMASFSLLQSVTGGADWGELAEPFCKINGFHCAVY